MEETKHKGEYFPKGCFANYDHTHRPPCFRNHYNNNNVDGPRKSSVILTYHFKLKRFIVKEGFIVAEQF